MMEKSVVSLPPCWVALEVNAPPTFPCSAPRHPQLAGLLPEAAHRRRHAAEPRRRADHDRVIVRQFLDLGDWSRLIELEVEGLGDLVGDVLRHPLDVSRSARGARAFRHRMGHLLDVAETRIIENKHLGHVTPPRARGAGVFKSQRTVAIWSKENLGLRGNSFSWSP